MHNEIKELFIKSLADQSKSEVYIVLEDLINDYPQEMAVTVFNEMMKGEGDHTCLMKELDRYELSTSSADEQQALDFIADMEGLDNGNI